MLLKQNVINSLTSSAVDEFRLDQRQNILLNLVNYQCYQEENSNMN
jgi:hypothetical protein